MELQSGTISSTNIHITTSLCLADRLMVEGRRHLQRRQVPEDATVPRGAQLMEVPTCLMAPQGLWDQHIPVYALQAGHQ